MTSTVPFYVDGGLAIDDRGEVGFCNDFDFREAGIRRSYWLRNHKAGFVRAWHGHQREAKYITVVAGTALVMAIRIDLFEKFPDIDNAYGDGTYRVVLSAKQPRVLYVPPGYANGSMALEDDTVIVHYSTMTLEETRGDDIRFPATRFSKVWEVEPR